MKPILAVLFCVSLASLGSNAHADEAWNKVITFMEGRGVQERIVSNHGENFSSVWVDLMNGVNRIAIANDNERTICVMKFKSDTRACWDLISIKRSDELLDAANKAWIVQKSHSVKDAESALSESDKYFRWLDQQMRNENLDDAIAEIAEFHNADASQRYAEEMLFPRR
jgi:hypothetical protein